MEAGSACPTELARRESRAATAPVISIYGRDIDVFVPAECPVLDRTCNIRLSDIGHARLFSCT